MADLWAVRGWETRVEDTTVVAERDHPTAERRVMLVDPEFGAGSDDEGLDGLERAAVTDLVLRGGTSRRLQRIADQAHLNLIDTTELHRALCYAVSRTDADRLCQRHFDRSFAAADASSGGWVASFHERFGAASGRVTAAGAVLVLLLAIGAAGPSLITSGAVDASGEAAVRSPVPISSPTPVTTPPADAAAEGNAESRGTHERVTKHPCRRSAEAILDRQLRALSDHGSPDVNGVRTIWEFATIEFRWYTSSYRAFNQSMHGRPFVHLLRHDNASYRKLPETDHVNRYEVTVTGADEEQYTYVFTLEREEAGREEGCWRTSGLSFRIPGSQTPTPASNSTTPTPAS